MVTGHRKGARGTCGEGGGRTLRSIDERAARDAKSRYTAAEKSELW